MPHAYKMQKEHGKDGLVVVLTEAQNPSMTKADLVGFTLINFHKYGNDDVFITQSEEPFRTDAPGLPHAALVGVDGKILLLGNPNGWGKKLDEALAEEFKKIKSGWGKSAEAKKARALIHGKRQLAEAFALLTAAEGKIKDDAKDDFSEVKAELEAKYASLKEAVKTLTERGSFLDAKKAAESLQKSVKGKSEWEAEVAQMTAEFAKPEVEKELAADKALTAILKSIGDKRPTDDHAKNLKALAKKHDGTKVGARAGELAVACDWKDPSVGPKDKDKDKDGKDKEKPAKDDKSKPGG